MAISFIYGNVSRKGREINQAFDRDEVCAEMATVSQRIHRRNVSTQNISGDILVNKDKSNLRTNPNSRI
jgi:hypothetical protein